MGKMQKAAESKPESKTGIKLFDKQTPFLTVSPRVQPAQTIGVSGRASLAIRKAKGNFTKYELKRLKLSSCPRDMYREE